MNHTPLCILLQHFELMYFNMIFQAQKEQEREKKRAGKGASAGSSKTLYIVGGGVVAVAAIAAGVLLYKRIAPSRFTHYR